MTTHAIADSEEAASSYDDFAISLGITDELHGTEREWLPAREPHTLAIGAAGQGKTVLVRHVLRQVKTAGWETWLAAAHHGRELNDSEADRISHSAEEYFSILDDAQTVMNARYRLLYEGLTGPHRPMLIAIEAPTVDNPAILDRIRTLLRLGRSARIHLLVTNQRPGAALLIGDTGSNFAHRISLGRLSPQGALILFNNHTGTMDDLKKPGTGYIISPDAKISRLRIPALNPAREGGLS